MQKTSRRSFLFGGLGALVGAAGSVVAMEETSLGERLGLRSGPDYRPADGRVPVTSGSFDSTHLRTKVGWSLAMPKGRAPLGTLFCLHGRSGDHTRAFQQLRLHDMVAEQHLPLAIAAVDGADHSYWHRRADGTDAMAMLLQELVPMIEARTGTSRRALYGWSMGGYGALLAAGRDPDRFAAVVALSPALWTAPARSAPGAFDGAEDFRANDVFALRDQLARVPVRISCGDSDPFASATKAFVAGLPSAQVQFNTGAHTAAYWRSVSPAALAFVASHLVGP